MRDVVRAYQAAALLIVPLQDARANKLPSAGILHRQKLVARSDGPQARRVKATRRGRSNRGSPRGALAFVAIALAACSEEGTNVTRDS
jgi:hypothetical protein